MIRPWRLSCTGELEGDTRPPRVARAGDVRVGPDPGEGQGPGEASGRRSGT